MRPSLVTLASDEPLTGLLRRVVDVIAVVVTDMVGGRPSYDVQQRQFHFSLGTYGSSITCSFPSLAMSRAAKATLIASIVVSSLTVWGVHYLQQREHNVRMPFPDPPMDFANARFLDNVPGCSSR